MTWLTDRLGKLIDKATEAVQAATSRAGEWKRTMQGLLTRYHIAQAMTGAGSTTLAPEQIARVKDTVKQQLSYLEGFADEIASGKLSPEEIAARAAQYTGGPRTSFWLERMTDIPVPAQPGQDSECLSNCRCSWDIQEVDAKAGDYDLYWRLGGAKQHCGTCLWRAANWAPFRVRGGQVVE